MSQPQNEDVPADRLIVTTRIVEAPRELVWKVWTDPQHLAYWYGPTGFTTTTDTIDVRPGGQWRFTMHGPDGHAYKNLITYLEVSAPVRLVYQHGGEQGLEPVDFRTTVTFEAIPGERARTRLTMRAVFASAKAREFVIREYDAAEGGRQTLARMADLVEAMAQDGRRTASPPFVLQRVVKAPRDLVFRVWTEAKHLARWFGPRGCTLEVRALDLRPGGTFHYAMRWAGKGEMWGKWVFREIKAPERLVYMASFADPQGNVVRAPFAGSWPLEMLSEVTFEPHAGLGKGTVITLRTSAHNAPAADQKTFDDGHPSMRGGWGGTFDQLDAYLAEVSRS